MIYNGWLYYEYMVSKGWIKLDNVCAIGIRKLNSVTPPDWYKKPVNFDELLVTEIIKDGATTPIYQAEYDQTIRHFDAINNRLLDNDNWVRNIYLQYPTLLNLKRVIGFRVEYGLEVHAIFDSIGVPIKSVKSTQEGEQYIRSLIMKTGDNNVK